MWDFLCTFANEFTVKKEQKNNYNMQIHGMRQIGIHVADLVDRLFSESIVMKVLSHRQLNFLGTCYVKEARGRMRDTAKAERLFRVAADRGNIWAMSNIGMMYFRGDGVQRDYAEAVTWYIKAAEKGNHKAQNSLGACYAKGWGVHRDLDQAEYWFQQAAAQGDEKAKDNLLKLTQKRANQQ